MITEGYDRCRLQKLPSMPNHERKLSTTLTIPTMTYAEIRATGMMVIGAWVRKLRYGGRDHFWMFSGFSLRFFSSLDLGPVQMALAWVFTTSQWRWSFPVHRIRRKVAIELSRSVVGLMGSYDCVRTMIVSFFASLSFPFLFHGLCSPEGLRIKRGIM